MLEIWFGDIDLLSTLQHVLLLEPNRLFEKSDRRTL